MSVFKTFDSNKRQLRFLISETPKPKPKAKAIVIDIKAAPTTPVDSQHKHKPPKTKTICHSILCILCFLPVWCLKRVHIMNTCILQKYDELDDK